MKILVVQDYLRSGGTERQSVLLANAFAARGHSSTLLTFRPGGALAGTVSASVKRLSLQNPDRGLDWLAPKVCTTVEQIEPDVILCMGRMANCYAGILQRRLATRTRATPVVTTMRTGKRLPWFFRRSLKICRHTVANSADARATLVGAYQVPADRITVIHNSLVFPSVSAVPRNTAMRAEQGAHASTVVLLCVAMFRPEKNQRELIEIASGLPSRLDWQLWLAGEGPARATCEQLAAAKNLTARVKFPGFLRDPSSLYAAADIAVHASWSESLSNFLIEAQAHGLPVVAYDAQGIGETFVPNETGWLIPRDNRTAFAGAVERLATQTDAERSALATQARRFARTTFDADRQVDAYLDLFAKLLTLPQP